MEKVCEAHVCKKFLTIFFLHVDSANVIHGDMYLVVQKKSYMFVPLMYLFVGK